MNTKTKDGTITHTLTNIRLGLGTECITNVNDMVKCGSVVAAQDRHAVTKDTLHREGFGGWWNPTDHMISTFCVYGTECRLVGTSPWDGAPQGRLGLIGDEAPPQRP